MIQQNESYKYSLSLSFSLKLCLRDFVHAGNIGQFIADGIVQIVDRKMYVVKLEGDKYVELEAMDTVFVGLSYYMVLIVMANGDLYWPLAMVCTVPPNDALEKWANEAGIICSAVHDLAGNLKACQEVAKSCVTIGKETELTKMELQIKDIALITGRE